MELKPKTKSSKLSTPLVKSLENVKSAANSPPLNPTKISTSTPQLEPTPLNRTKLNPAQRKTWTPQSAPLVLPSPNNSGGSDPVLDSPRNKLSQSGSSNGQKRDLNPEDIPFSESEKRLLIELVNTIVIGDKHLAKFLPLTKDNFVNACKNGILLW